MLAYLIQLIPKNTLLRCDFSVKILKLTVTRFTKSSGKFFQYKTRHLSQQCTKNVNEKVVI